MMIRKKIYWILIVLSVTGIIVYFNSYTELTPLLLGKNDYIRIKIDSTLSNNLARVLEYHNEPYRKGSSNSILVKRTLTFDKELVFNYTLKALDSAWLNSNVEKGLK